MYPHRRRIVIVCAAVLSAVAVGTGCTPSAAGPAGPPPIPAVTVVQPVPRSVSDAEEFTGRLQAVDSVEIRARVNGYLTKRFFEPGAEVKKGQDLFEIDPRPYQAQLDEADAQVKLTQARLAYQDAELNRMRTLLSRQAASREDFDRTVAARAEADASVIAAKAQVESARLNVEFTRVIAPVAGRTSRDLLTIGNLVTADTTLLTTIVSIDPIYAYFDVDERSMLKVQRLIAQGKVVSARVDKAAFKVGLQLADETGFPHEGTIDFVENQVSAGTGTIQCRAVFANASGFLTPGVFVRIRIPIGQPYEAPMVPERAIGMDQGQRYVLVVGASDKVEYRPVQVGPKQGLLRAVLEGVTASDRVIVEGLQRARPGSVVKPEEANLEAMLAPKKAAAGAAPTKPATTETKS